IAVSMIGPVRTSLLSYAEPMIAAGLGVILLGEALAPVQIAGLALVVTALVGSTLWQPRGHCTNKTHSRYFGCAFRNGRLVLDRHFLSADVVREGSRPCENLYI